MKALLSKILFLIILPLVFCAIFLVGCRDVLHDIQGAKYYPAINKDTINRYDANGQKKGYWLEILDTSLSPINNTHNAAYYRFSYYISGSFFSDYPSGWSRSIFPDEVSFVSVSHHSDSNCMPKKDTLVCINGEYKFYDKKGRLLGEKYYRNGILLYSKSYFENGKLYGEIDNANYPFGSKTKEYYPNGNLQDDVSNDYKDSIFAAKWYYKNGKLQNEGISGKVKIPSSICYSYYKNGNIRKKKIFLKEVNWSVEKKKYYKNGRLKSDKKFKGIFLRTGKKYYDENGNEIK